MGILFDGAIWFWTCQGPRGIQLLVWMLLKHGLFQVKRSYHDFETRSAIIISSSYVYVGSRTTSNYIDYIDILLDLSWHIYHQPYFIYIVIDKLSQLWNSACTLSSSGTMVKPWSGPRAFGPQKKYREKHVKSYSKCPNYKFFLI